MRYDGGPSEWDIKAFALSALVGMATVVLIAAGILLFILYCMFVGFMDLVVQALSQAPI